MNILPKNIFYLCITAVFLAACSGESSQSTSESSGNLTLAKDTPMAYVERGVSQTVEANKSHFKQVRREKSQSPLERYSPYHFNPGAKLYERSGIDVDAVSTELLTGYFGSNDYDVKDLNISSDGRRLVFAAHGPRDHPTDYSWNIYEYDFDTKVVQRIIADHAEANKRSDDSLAHDTNPAYDQDGNIIFSSNRAAGNPDSLVPTTIPLKDAEYCTKVTLKEDPSLLHSMSSTGENILQLTYGYNHDTHPTLMNDGRIAFIRWSFSYDAERVEHCSADVSKSILSTDLLKSSEAAPIGMNKPSAWSNRRLCGYSEVLKIGSKGGEKSVLHTNNYTILSITADGKSIDQLYKTVSVKEDPSEEGLVFLDRIVQTESGKLVGVLKHKVNASLGGNIVELGSPQSPKDNKMFGNIAPSSLAAGDTQILPGYLSKNGWYSALWPYRDGSSRLLVSWTQCLVTEAGVSKFCQDAIGDNNTDSKYGLWVISADGSTRSPVVTAAVNRVFEDVVLSRPQQGLDFPFEPYKRNYDDSLIDSQIICNYPDPVNSAPVANAGADQAVVTGAQVTLDGSKSRDPEDSPLTFSWTVSSRPEGANVSLDATSATPTFTANQSGTYKFQLVVNDGELSSTDDVSVTATPSPNVPNNTAPTANAGDDQTTWVGEPLTLDGSGSSDPEDNPLTYQWSVVATPSDPSDGSDSNSIFSDRNVAKPSITPTMVGDYTFRLVVNDGNLDSAPSFVRVTSRQPNRRPVANAGNDQSNLLRGSTHSLSGSASDEDSDVLNFNWTVVSPEGASLSNANTATPSIVVSEFGEYTIQLIVDDGKLESEPATVTLKVVNRKPVAQINHSINNNPGENKVSLDGSSSDDPEGERLTYRWELVTPSGSAATLSNVTAEKPEFTPDLTGDYVVKLVVKDDQQLESDPTEVSIDFKQNTPPVADAGQYRPITTTGPYQLDGSGSTDVDVGDQLSYQWTVSSPSGITIKNPSSVRPTVDVTAFGEYEVQLTVSDGVASDTDTAQITFDNVKPVAVIDVQPSTTVALDTTIILDASQSTDLNQSPLTYRWKVTAPDTTEVSLSPNASSVTSAFVKTQNGVYIAELTVNDGALDSEAVTVAITSTNSKPIADPGDYNNVSPVQSLALDGSGSRDVDGDTLTFQWSLLSKPENSSATLANANVKQPILENIDQVGDYVVQLIVNDGQEDSDPETTLISSENLKPVADAGDNTEITLGETVSLNGSNSSDPNGDDINYRWSFTTVPSDSSVTTAEFDDAFAARPTFTPDVEGLYVAQLIVEDDQLSSDPKTVNIKANPPICTVVNPSNTLTFPVIIRDFKASHPDFEAYIGSGEKDIVKPLLGDDGLPVYAHGEEGTDLTSGRSHFDQWYRDVPGVNLNVPLTLTMTRKSGTTNEWYYSNDQFFPINDDVLPQGVVSWGNTPGAVAMGLNRNYHFTMEVRLEFDYEGGETFYFKGDDDLWVFINDKLAVDLGGVQYPGEATIALDDLASSLGIAPGNRYSFDLFFAERKLTESNFNFETSINLSCVTPESQMTHLDTEAFASN